MSIRVLIIDDSVVARQQLARMLSADDDIEVLRPAPSGAIGLTRIEAERPDVVILDVEMPQMDGLETLRRIRQSSLDLPVIMFSALTDRGANTTLEALSIGASDYLTKPSARNETVSPEQVGAEMVAKVRALVRTDGKPPGTPAVARPSSPPARRPTGPAEIVVVGVSTGGPNALATLLAGLPADLPVPVLVVQHMPPKFTEQLARRLDKASALTVREGVAGAELRRGEVWIAPGGYHMVVEREGVAFRLALNEDPKVNSCRPAVDPLFETVAAGYGDRVLATVLTGMGQDGLHGCEAVRERGGRIVVQDEATSVVWGMPGYVARAGLADQILPLDEIADSIVVACQRRAVVR